MNTIFLGTNNQNKLAEFTRILSPLGLEFKTPKNVRVFNFDPPETGKTFQENSYQKALAWSQRVSLPTLAEDSGLCIDILGGLPGIKSKRFHPGTDRDRNLHVLKLLEKYSDLSDRSAHYICSLTFYDPETQTQFTTQGECYGRISYQESGKNGFGYDPIFIPAGFTQTLGELTANVKDSLSHRQKAIKNMLPLLKKWQKDFAI